MILVLQITLRLVMTKNLVIGESPTKCSVSGKQTRGLLDHADVASDSDSLGYCSVRTGTIAGNSAG
jgi:hypothetical protein